MSWKENKGLAVILLIIALGVIGFAGYKLMPAKFDDTLKCEKCGDVVKMQVSANTKYPTTCPKCKTPTLYQTVVLKCMKCKAADGKPKEVPVIDKHEEGKNPIDTAKCDCGSQLMP